MGTLLEGQHYMSIAALGKFSIDITPIESSGMYHVDIQSDNRKDVVSMQTNVGETPDQLGIRIKSMLRALLNGEPKILPEEKLDVPSDHLPSKKQSKPNKESNPNL